MIWHCLAASDLTITPFTCKWSGNPFRKGGLHAPLPQAIRPNFLRPAMEIQSYRFGYIEIDGKAYRNDVRLIGDKVLPEWWRGQGHYVDLKDAKDLLAAEAEVCVFGTGAYGSMRISPAVKSAFEDRGVQVITDKTSAACNLYNRLAKEGKKVIAGFHLTC